MSIRAQDVLFILQTRLAFGDFRVVWWLMGMGFPDNRHYG
jgi:hypothetical protein